MSQFSLVVFKILSLYLAFSSLKCLHIILFAFTLRFLELTESIKLTFFIKFEFLVIIHSTLFCPFIPLFLRILLHLCWKVYFFFFFNRSLSFFIFLHSSVFLFFRLGNFYWLIFKFTDPASAISNLLFISSFQLL